MVTFVTKPKCTINIDNADISTDQKNRFLALLGKFKDLFPKNEYDVGKTHLSTHTIDTGDAAPIRQHPYRTPIKQQEVIKEEIDKMLEKGVISPSTSPWSSPVVLVPKKSGGYRFCIYFRKINAVTRKYSFPLPHIGDIIDAVRGATVFSSLDQAWGYWQIPIAEKDREKTAFVTYDGLYQFNVVPFGLTNAPGTFQRLMSVILSGLQWTKCPVYLDDVIVFGRDFDEHLSRLEEVFYCLKKAGLKLRLSKCKFLMQKISYLGHEISAKGINPDAEKVRSIENFPTPTDIDKLRSFLGLVGYYRRFVENVSFIAHPLHSLLKKGVTFLWNSECERAFNELKSVLMKNPILVHPNFDKPFILLTDASGVGIGAILAQETEKGELPIAYASRSLTKAERNYGVTELEALAVVWGVKHFKHYLYKQRVTIVTDHSALQQVLTKPNPSGQIARWGLELQDLQELTIRHRPGRKHNNVDALSRAFCNQATIQGLEPRFRRLEKTPSERQFLQTTARFSQK